jgi:Bacterial SH3 domain
MARDKNMRKIVRLCLGLGVFSAFVAPAVTELAMTGAAATMRVAPTSNAGVVQHIPQRTVISLEKCARAWCRASRRGRFGYVPADAVVLKSPLETLPGEKMPPPVANRASAEATHPAWRWTGPYIGLNGGFGSGSW